MAASASSSPSPTTVCMTACSAKSAPKHDDGGRAGSKACPTCSDAGPDERKNRKIRQHATAFENGLGGKVQTQALLGDSILRLDSHPCNPEDLAEGQEETRSITSAPPATVKGFGLRSNRPRCHV